MKKSKERTTLSDLSLEHLGKQIPDKIADHEPAAYRC